MPPPRRRPRRAQTPGVMGRRQRAPTREGPSFAQTMGQVGEQSRRNQIQRGIDAFLNPFPVPMEHQQPGYQEEAFRVPPWGTEERPSFPTNIPRWLSNMFRTQIAPRLNPTIGTALDMLGAPAQFMGNQFRQGFGNRMAPAMGPMAGYTPPSPLPDQFDQYIRALTEPTTIAPSRIPVPETSIPQSLLDALNRGIPDERFIVPPTQFQHPDAFSTTWQLPISNLSGEDAFRTVWTTPTHPLGGRGRPVQTGRTEGGFAPVQAPIGQQNQYVGPTPMEAWESNLGGSPSLAQTMGQLGRQRAQQQADAPRTRAAALSRTTRNRRGGL